MCCCQGLKNFLSMAGDRGHAILVYEVPSGKIGFQFQSRGIAYKDVSKIKPNPNASDIKINVSSEIGIQYCPACGHNLEKLIKKNPIRFKELATKHRHLFMHLL